MEHIAVLLKNLQRRNWKLCLVSDTPACGSAKPDYVQATLFQKLPNLKLAIPFDEIEYSAPTKDIGIAELPIGF